MDVPRAPQRPSRRYVLLGVGAVGLALAAFGIERLGRAAPSVERSSVWIDTVSRGAMLRQASGPGTLVPEKIRWITARTAGRVERLRAEPGMRVEPDHVLAELSNPDLELATLEAERELRAAEAHLERLRANALIEQLAQEAVVANVRMESREAARRREAAERLAEQDIVGTLELLRAREKAEELATRLRLEQDRGRALATALRARTAAQEAEIERLRALAAFRDGQRASLRVRAGMSGVLQELPLEVGQQVTPGMLLAKVVDPDRLGAEVRIPEAQARDIRLGQPASVDTRNGVVRGRVARIDPAVENGSVTVEIALGEPLPAGARPDLSVDGRIELERLEDVLHVGRPTYGGENAHISLFVVDGGEAVRVPVRLGRASVSEVEVVDGLREGDRVILSDTSEWDAVDRIELE